MKNKRILAIALTLCMLLSMVPAMQVRAVETGVLDFEKISGGDLGVQLPNNPALGHVGPVATMDPNETVKVIIVLDGQGVAQGKANVVMSPQIQSQMDALEEQQNVVLGQIEHQVLDGQELDVDYNYTWLMNAVATTVPYGAIEEIEAMEGVDYVIVQQVYTVCETADPNTITDGVMIGRENTWANGYTGEGMKIAIIDTGLDTDHPNFAALPADKLTDTSATADSVDAVLESLNASSRQPGLTIEDVYYSTKVAYGFNYCDDNTNITHDYDSAGDHGTHVAGIAASNKIDGSEVVGVAPDAQLYVMKVFGANGGAYTMDILAALEDALMLGADVINMSLGSPAGFTSGGQTEQGDPLDPVYEAIASTGTILSVSAGNNYNSALLNVWGNNMNPTAWPDNGVVGSPGTYANTMTVASVENWKIQRNFIDAGGYHMVYNDTGMDYDLPVLTSLTGSYELVVVPGLGDVSDYEGLDVAGKVALVQRGTLSFADKHANAEAAGAVATLVYSNTTGEFGMDMTGTKCTTPAVSITMADGEYLIAALETNPGLKLSFPTSMEGFPSETAYEMSDFSSVGPAPDLTLAPDITAPGGNIYSTINNGEYGLMSGTSMAAPNIAGISAVVMQYVKENFPAGTDYRAVTQSLLMSTSVPLIYGDSGVPYSPRSQGSGLANAFNAVTSKAYLTMDGADNVKADLGDDPQRTGAFSFQFNVHNFGQTAVYYRLDTITQTESYVEEYDVYFMSGTPRMLNAQTSEKSGNLVLTHDVDNDRDTDSHDAYLLYRASVQGQELSGWEQESFRYDVNGDEAVAAADVQAYLDALVGNPSAADLEDQVLKVNGGKTAVVTVDVKLTDADKTYLDTYFVNGGYVEGFTTLTALNHEGVDLSLPYLGFYGGWGEAPMLDTGYYYDVIDGTAVYNQTPHVLFTEFQGDEYGMYPGVNPYVEEPFNMDHVALSPNGDGQMDTISDIYVSLMRNAKLLTLTFTDMETQEELWGVAIDNVSKSVYYPSFGSVIPFAYDVFIASPALYNWDGLENNSRVLFKAEAVGLAEGDEPEIWEVPITVDTEAPELISASVEQDPETGKRLLTLSFRDNQYVSAVVLLNSNNTEMYAVSGVEDPEADEHGYRNYTYTYDLTDVTGKLVVAICDYAANESFYAMNAGGEGTPYGDLVAYQYNYFYGTNGWVSFDQNVDENEIQISTDDSGIVCAEYVNGYVFAQDETGALYGAKYEELLADTMEPHFTFIAQLENVYQDLAYNYADGNLYGLYTYEDQNWDGTVWPTTTINSINMKGAYYDEENWMDVAPYQESWVAQYGSIYALTMTIDDDGVFYLMANELVETEDPETWEITQEYSDAQLWTVTPVEEEMWGSIYVTYNFDKVADTGLGMDFLQSMTWDHNDEKLYWARFYVEGWDLYDELIEVDPTTGECTVVGDLSGETFAMFAPLTAEAAAKPEHANVPVIDADVIPTPILRDDVITMSTGSTYQLTYDLDPWYTDHTDLVWSSSDETVATVDANGKVTALSGGSVTITVAAAGDETKFDSVTVEVSALSLNFQGIITNQGAGVGATLGVGLYEFTMDQGAASLTNKSAITAPQSMNFGLSLATSELGRGGYVWACEYGNTGMIYKIDPITGQVVDFLEPIDGDMLFGLHYSESMDSFSAIMDMYLYVDQPFNAWAQEQILNSYDENYHEFMWRKLDMLPYLIESNNGFVTGEDGNGASSEIVFCGITGVDGGIQTLDPYSGEFTTFVEDSYKTYLGDWDYSGTQVMYQPTQTLILLDNVGRLWYIDEVAGLVKETDDWGNVTLSDDKGSMITGMPEISYDENWNEVYGDTQYRNGVIELEIEDENGNVSYNAFVIRKIDETPLTKMFREGTMPRITYHFSDIEWAGYTGEGDPMIAMSLYDYWNEGTTNELYLYIPGHETDEMDYDTWEPIRTPDRLFNLGNTGDYNIIATIHSATVTGGVDKEETASLESAAVNPLAAGIYKKQ